MRGAVKVSAAGTLPPYLSIDNICYIFVQMVH